MTSNYFEQQVRQDIAVRQFQEGWQQSHFVTDQELADFIRLNEQKRDIRYVQLPAVVIDPNMITDEQAQEFYQQQLNEFMVPERVKLAYLHLSAETLSARIAIDETVLRTYFAEHQETFITPEERKLRHILLADKIGDEAAQLAKAQTLLAELSQGADFAELAKTHSEDTGSAILGGDLGWMGREAFVKPFADSAFTLALGMVSEPIKTTFGYHLIQVEAVRGGASADFDAQREKIVAAYREQQVEALYYDDFERLADVVYENPDSLAAASELLGIPIKETDWLEVTSTFPAPLDHTKVQQAVFSDDVIQGNNSEVIERSPIDAIVLRVVVHEPATRKPFEEVREQVLARLVEQQTQEQTQQRGQESLQALRDGADLASIAGITAQKSLLGIGRKATDRVPAEINRAAFAIAGPILGERSYTGVMGQAGDYYLIAIDQVVDGNSQMLEAEALNKHQALLNDEQRTVAYQQLRAALRGLADVSIQVE